MALSRNSLTELPPEVGQWQQLQQIQLSGNVFTDLPPQAGQWQQLQEIDLSNNSLTQLRTEVGQWRQLQSINLSENSLTELPPEVGQWQQLQQIQIFNNSLTELPPEVGQWQRLQKILLFDNSLTEFPPEVGRWGQLNDIDLRNNPLRHPPLSVCKRGPQAVVAYMQAAQHKQTRPNDVLLLVGHGGCGKTTFTRAMANDNNDFRLIVKKAKDLVEEWDSDQLKTWILELMMMEAGMEGLEAREIVNVEDPSTVLPTNNKMTKKMIDVMKSEWWTAKTGMDGEEWIDEDEEDNWKTLEKVLKKFKKTRAKVKMARDLLMSVEDEEKFNLIVNADPKLIYQPLTFLPHVRTVGIDEDQIWRGFRIWDMAGQAEYLPAHSLFMAETSAVYLVLCDVRHTDEERERQWRCWLSFIQALIPEEFREEAEKTTIPAVSVVMALTHCDEAESSRIKRAQKHGKEVFSCYEKYLGLVNDQVFALNYCDATTIDAVKTALVQQSSRVQHLLLDKLMENDNNLEVALKKSSEELNDVDNSGSSTSGLVVQRALDVGVDLKTIRTRFETCSTLTDATKLVNDLAKEKLDAHDPPVVPLAAFKEKLMRQQSPINKNTRVSFAGSLLRSTIGALTGAGIIRITGKKVVLQPIQWLAKKLGIIIEKHDPQKDRHGILDIDFLDKTCNISAKHGRALLKLLVVEGLACWKTENQRESVFIPLMMKRATPQQFGEMKSFVGDQRPFKVGRRFKIKPANDGGTHDQLPAGFFNVLQISVMNRFQHGQLKQFAGLATGWVAADGGQQPTLLIVCSHGHYFDVIAIGNSTKFTMSALQLGCFYAGECWQSHSGLKLIKTALCVDCAFEDQQCDSSNVKIETKSGLPRIRQMFDVQATAEDKQARDQCIETPTKPSSWCLSQSNTIHISQLLLLTNDEASLTESTHALLAHLTPQHRIEIAKACAAQWEDIAAQFGYTKESIEIEVVGGQPAPALDKSKHLIEKLAKQGITTQQMSNAIQSAGLTGVLETELSHILPSERNVDNKRKSEQSNTPRKKQRK